MVILEAFVVGVPCVATDVGACREIILGAADGLGSAGFVTQVGSPEETAAALIELARNPDLVARCREAGRQRVRRYYDHEDMIRSYREVYTRLKGDGLGRDRLSATAAH